MEEMANKDLGMQSPFYSSNPQSNMQPMKEPEKMVTPMMVYQITFPEIFYKLHPYIMMVCDHLDSMSPDMPTQEMMDDISDGIFDDISRRDPNLAAYLRAKEDGNPDPAMQDPPPLGFRRPFRFRFRRRGLGRDLIDILLLSELFRRRRRSIF